MTSGGQKNRAETACCDKNAERALFLVGKIEARAGVSVCVYLCGVLCTLLLLLLLLLLFLFVLLLVQEKQQRQSCGDALRR